MSCVFPTVAETASESATQLYSTGGGLLQHP